MSTSQASLPEQLLLDHLRREDPVREKSVARFMTGMAAMSAAIAFALTPAIGTALGLSLAGLSLTLLLWYGGTWWALARGVWHPAVSWINVTVEVTLLTTVFALDAKFRGPEYALSAPTLVMWGALIFVAVLRSRRILALYAGVLAAVEYVTLYGVYVRPMLGPDPLITFSPAFIAIRAVFLAASGVLAAIVAGHLLSKSEQALRAVREKDLFGKYFLHERLGAGGMAEVFRATYSPEGGFQKVVAVKRILPGYSSSQEFVEMFRREARFGSLLNHPNIVQVFDVGRFNGSLFLALEYVEGLSLHALLDRREGSPLPLPVITFIGAEVASALDYMHQRTEPDGTPLALVHRDLNPPNLLLSRIGEVKLADFGIARAQAADRSMTRVGIVRGKPGYMSPEQAEDAPIDGRSDLFALGLTLHEALTGQPLLQGHDEVALMEASLAQPLAPPSAWRRDVPPALDAIVMGLLERDLDKRIRTGAELRAKLLALPRAIAPFPEGQRLLAEVVSAAMGKGARTDYDFSQGLTQTATLTARRSA